MQKQSFESIADPWKAGITVMQQFDQLTWQVWLKGARQQMDFAGLCTDYGSQEEELWLSSKNPMEFFSAQSRLAKEFTEKWIELSQEATSMMIRPWDEWISAMARFQPAPFWGTAYTASKSTAGKERESAPTSPSETPRVTRMK